MPKLNDKIINYHASFVIDHQDSKITFYAILEILKKWLKEKEYKFDKFGMRDVYNAFSQFDQPFSTSFGKNTKKRYLKIQTSDSEGKKLWGFEYSHPQFNERKSMLLRYWYVEVYITSFKNTNDVAVYVCVSYSWNRTKMLEERDAQPPQPTVPGFMTNLVRTFDLHMEGCPFSFSLKPYVVNTKEEVEPFIDLLKDEERKTFILLSTYSPTYSAAEEFLKKMAGKVLGKALFFHIDPTKDAFKCLKKQNVIERLTSNTIYIISEMRKGRLGVQWISSPPGPTSAYFDGITERLQEFFYRNQIVLADGAITSFSAISSANLFERFQKERKAKLSAQDAKEAADDNAHEAEILFEEIYGRKEILEKENVALKDENKNLRNKRAHDQCEYERKIAELKLQIDNIEFRLLDALHNAAQRKKLRDKVECLKEILSSRLVFTDKALASLSKCKSENEGELIEGLIALYHILWPIHIQGAIGQRIEDVFKTTKFEYSPNENKGTMANPGYRKDRTVTHDGKDYECENHLKFGKDGRIYFMFSEELNKIVLCVLGPHLDTVGTKRKSLN